VPEEKGKKERECQRCHIKKKGKEAIHQKEEKKNVLPAMDFCAIEKRRNKEGSAHGEEEKRGEGRIRVF